MMHWEGLLECATFALRRSGRFVVASLTTPHRVVSTSFRHGGQVEHVRYLVNHQSCEAAAHADRHCLMMDPGLDAYHDRLCAEIDLPAEETVVMGTAANMNYTALASLEDQSIHVTAAVTAGVQGNATTAGEPASWRETDMGTEKVAVYSGTINTMLLVNQPLTAGAQARAVMTLTEGKSAALQQLAVGSRTHMDLATGTGTDQYCLAAPLGGARPLTSASPHLKLGELIGAATRDATLEALRWQNGLEPSYTRGLFHALARYGVKEATIFDELAPLLSEGDLDLLRKNAKSAFYEPVVGAAAHALATVGDRTRHGTLPASVSAEALTQQAAMLAVNLAAQVHRFTEFRERLRPHADAGLKRVVLAALALGWSEKWRTP